MTAVERRIREHREVAKWLRKQGLAAMAEVRERRADALEQRVEAKAA